MVRANGRPMQGELTSHHVTTIATCAACGASLRPAMRFCGRCGLSAPASHPPPSQPSPFVVPPAPAPLLDAIADDAAPAERYLWGLLNRERAIHGAGPLILEPALSAIARAHGRDLALPGRNLWPGWPHAGSDGCSPFQRMAAGGYSLPPYTTVGENIGWTQGYPSTHAAAAVVHAGMMAEPSGQPNHRATILDPWFRLVGVGIVVGDGTVWITQDFAG